MKPTEKDAVMQRFASGQTQILVSTTVIEVGVNVPNASVMIIESAQRFGLSQLHQLRGRVGRGAEQSYCILLTPYELSPTTKKRIEIMTESNDGFLIAEADLKLRGPGDIEGTQQSGIPFNLKIADIVRDNEILYFAREVAEQLIESDPKLDKAEHAVLKQQLNRLSGNRYDWSRIS
jgi:ATP-dependent DNA helicase RecG